jgi:hypothetical protein
VPVALSLAIAVLWLQPALSEKPPENFSFFVTSRGLGQGGDLGGLAGADAHCTKLAAGVGAGAGAWRAYLSVAASGAVAAVNARDRIGNGPWFNVKGVLVARDLADLHGLAPALTKETSLTEKGEIVSGIGDDPVDHDILTGSQADGTAFPGPQDKTCGNWSSSSAGSAQVGHHDRQGGPRGDLTSWNSAHGSRGCSLELLARSGGSGRFYCFARR